MNDRQSATLTPIIKHFVPAGRKVTSDAWGAYARLRYEGYNHLVVVHKRYLQISHMDCNNCFVGYLEKLC